LQAQAVSEEVSGLPYNVTVTTFPNPFTDKVELEFTSEVSTWAVLQVYTLNGVMIETLFEGQLQANEPKRSTFIPSGIPAGFYVYRLSTGTIVKHGKMLLTK
jgi:hypothetical protein